MQIGVSTHFMCAWDFNLLVFFVFTDVLNPSECFHSSSDSKGGPKEKPSNTIWKFMDNQRNRGQFHWFEKRNLVLKKNLNGGFKNMQPLFNLIWYLLLVF